MTGENIRMVEDTIAMAETYIDLPFHQCVKCHCIAWHAGSKRLVHIKAHGKHPTV